jgi:hypothetical protein
MRVWYKDDASAGKRGGGGRSAFSKGRSRRRLSWRRPQVVLSLRKGGGGMPEQHVSGPIHGMRTGSGFRLGIGMLAMVCAPVLAGCSTAPPSSSAPAIAPVSITADELVGKWGLASYRVETDLARTQEAARRACSNPYVVAKGTTGGVMMYLADQSVAQEVFLKSGADGRVYIGPQGKPGDRRDRQIISYRDGVVVTQWVDPTVATRYGTMVFVRCAAA